MNLLEMFKSLSKEEKKEFVDLIKKEIQIEATIYIPKNFSSVYLEKYRQVKFQLFGQ